MKSLIGEKSLVLKNFYKKGGEKSMRSMRLVLVVGLIALVAGIASAYQTTDTVTLTVTPSYNLSVNISSGAGTFGVVGLGGSKTICVGDITNDGNASSDWHKRSADCGGASTNWSIIESGTPGTSEFRLLAVTTGTVDPDFYGAADASCIIGDHDVATGGIGVPDSGITNFTELSEGGAGCPSHPTNETRKLWVSIMMPSDVGSAEQQTITLSIKAETP